MLWVHLCRLIRGYNFLSHAGLEAERRRYDWGVAVETIVEFSSLPVALICDNSMVLLLLLRYRSLRDNNFDVNRED